MERSNKREKEDYKLEDGISRIIIRIHHLIMISFPARYSVVNFRLESHSLRFREVILHNMYLWQKIFICIDNLVFISTFIKKISNQSL